jgi:hypothetical protein
VLGVVAHTCNLSYLGGTDRENWDLRPVWAKSYQDPSQPTNKLGRWCVL